MPTIQIPADEMQKILWEDGDGQVISNTLIDTTRWSTISELVFKRHKNDEKTYQCTYSQGATESQDELPFEYDVMVPCTEVEEKEVLVKKWVAVPDEAE